MRRELEDAEVVLVVIGKHWLTVTDDSRMRRGEPAGFAG
jgi:hypothetical protein